MVNSTINRDGVNINKYSCSAELRGNSGTNISTIGVICHEFGHVCGAPDYYDTDYGTGGQYTGTGNWDLMAGGSWNGINAAGDCPAHVNGYQKWLYGWANPVLLSVQQQVTVFKHAFNDDFIILPQLLQVNFFIVKTDNSQDLTGNSRSWFDYISCGEPFIATAGNSINAGFIRKVSCMC
jgi:M6 family metalloprotease-like protein